VKNYRIITKSILTIMAKEKKLQQSATQEMVEVTDIKDDVVVMRNGSLRSVIRIGSMNFELKSKDEQTAIIIAFQNFLNAVDFPLQIVVGSRKLDINPYLKSLEGLLETETNELLKIQINDYTRFVRGLTELSNIMDKEFYIVVPFYIAESPTAAKTGVFGSLKSIFSPSKFIQSLTEEQLEGYRVQLKQRVEMVVDGIGGFGLQATVISGKDLINLYHGFYNPDSQ